MVRNILGVLIIIFGIASGTLFFIAGNQFSEASQNMKDLKTQSGNSLQEAYYREMGGLSKGLGFVSYGMGIGVFGISVAIGGKIILRHQLEETNYI